MIRQACRWLLTVLALAGAAGAAAVWYAWVEGDEYARQELQRRLTEIGPGCDLEIGRVRIDWDRSIHVRDFTVRPKGKGVAPTFSVPEAVIQIDRERFLNDQTVDVQVIHLIRPQLDVTRRADGSWTLDDLGAFRLDPTIAVPEWRIEDATLRFRLEQAGTEPVLLTLEKADLRLVPAGRRQLTIEGLSDVGDAGPLKVVGDLDLDRGTWSLSGSISGLSTSGNVAGFLLCSSSELRDKVATLGRQLRDAEETLRADDGPEVATNVVPIRTVSIAETPTASGPTGLVPEGDAPCDLAGLGVDALLDLTFAVAQREGGQPPEYEVQVECKEGEVVNPLLPFALRHLRGHLAWDNTSLTLTSFQADGGGTVLKVDGAFQLGGPAATGSINASVTNLVLSDRPSGPLPPALDRFLQTVRPRGPVDAAGSLHRDASGRWSMRGFHLTAKGVTATPEPFPYPIREITGTLRQRAEGGFDADMTGLAGMRPLSLTAQLGPGPDAAVGIRIVAPGVAVDETLREACKPEVRKVLTELRLAGAADVTVGIDRPAGPAQKYGWWFTAHVVEGELEYERFPYRLSKLSGDVSYASGQEILHVSNVAGRHGRAVVTGAATYRKTPEVDADGITPIDGPPPGLDLSLKATQVDLGEDLRAALPPRLRQLWEDLRPGGSAEVDARVYWRPGIEPDIELTRFDLTEGSLLARDFPYALDTITAKASYTPPRVEVIGGQAQLAPACVTITEFDGWHADGTWVSARNASVLVVGDGRWQLLLPQVAADDLRLGSDFRRAAPDGLRETIEALDTTGPLDVKGWLEIQSTGDPAAPVRAEWDLTGTLNDAAFRAGVAVTHASGGVRCGGVSEGGTVTLSGAIDLEQAEVLGQRLTGIRGPFRFENGQVQIGSREVLRYGLDAEDEPAVPLEERLTAKYLEPGLVTLDAVVSLAGEPRYVGRATLTGGALEQYARTQAGRGMRNLSGVMNGWVNFSGAGTTPSGVTGKGRLEIKPAALYELPVVMQILTSLSSPDNTAFRAAWFDFNIRDSAVWFDWFDRRNQPPIVLAGDALRLFGSGRVGFDGTLNIDLYTALPRARLVEAVPVVGGVVGGLLDAATTGWWSVVIRGPADNPFVQPMPLKVVPDGVRAMFDSLTPQRVPARTAIQPSPRR